MRHNTFKLAALTRAHPTGGKMVATGGCALSGTGKSAPQPDHQANELANNARCQESHCQGLRKTPRQSG